MEKLSILELIARQIIINRCRQNAFALTKEWTEAGKDMFDHAYQANRRSELGCLAPLLEADPRDIADILGELGPCLVIEYLQSRSGFAELAEHKPLYAACLKLGFADRTWDEVIAEAEHASGMFLKNPQMPIASGLSDKFMPAFQEFKMGLREIADLPYLSDRFYMNFVIRNVPAHTPELDTNDMFPDRLRLSRPLFDFVLARLEQEKSAPLYVDEELRLAGMVTLACRLLPGFNEFNPDWTEEDVTVANHLDRAVADMDDFRAMLKESTGIDPQRRALFEAYDESQYTAMCALRDRVLAVDHEILKNPVLFSFRIYDRMEEEKLIRLARINGNEIGANITLVPDNAPRLG